MKLMTFVKNQIEQVGIVLENEILPVNQFGYNFESMNHLIETITDEQMEFLKKQKSGVTYHFEEVRWLAPIPVSRQDWICLGMNYLEHAEESARYKKDAFDYERKFPVYFSKRVNLAVGQNQMIQSHKELVNDLDYECELGVIIRTECANISKDEADDHIFGYTIINDITARSLQTQHKQWYYGKSLDGFGVMGPWIVTKDEFETNPHFKIKSYVNQNVRQNADTSLLIFDVSTIISDLSLGMTLRPATVIATGTPKGVGMGFVPPCFLNSNDRIDCEIEGIGTLSNWIE